MQIIFNIYPKPKKDPLPKVDSFGNKIDYSEIRESFDPTKNKKKGDNKR